MEAQSFPSFLEQDADEDIIPLKRRVARRGDVAPEENEDDKKSFTNGDYESRLSVLRSGLSSQSKQEDESSEEMRKHGLEDGSENLPSTLSLKLNTLEDEKEQMIERSDQNGVETNVADIKEKDGEIPENFDLIEEDETEYDVEKVLAEQNTHDLFCPNCKSCITKRVILLRKRRKVQRINREKKLPEKEKIKNLEAEIVADGSVFDEKLPFSEIKSVDNANEDNESVGKVDVFRCLSCFSFFIPFGSGFKLFPIKQDTPDIQLSNQNTSEKKNWFPFIFSSEIKKQAKKEGYYPVKQEQKGSFLAVETQSERDLQSSNDVGVSSSVSDDQKASSEQAGKRRLKSAYKDIVHIVRVLSIMKANEARLNNLNKSADEIQEINNDHDEENKDKTVKDDPLVGQITTEHLNSLSGLLDQFRKIGILADPDTDVSGTLTNIKLPPSENDKIDFDQTVLRTEDQTKLFRYLTQEDSINQESDFGQTQFLQKVNINDLKKASTFDERRRLKTIDDETYTGVADSGNDLVVVIEKEPYKTEVTTAVENTGDLRTISYVTQPQTTTPKTEVNILSCIVFGGLAELVTSLGVVSSAAGAGAATVNVFGLGLANLCGGLFILIHNILDLRHDHSKEGSDQELDRERFLVLRALRSNFILYSLIIITSYVVFGALPPLVYCLTFSKSGNRDYKLILVGILSLLFIALLGIGKARIASESYIKTALYFVTLGILASGSAFLVGEFVIWLVEKLGWFEANEILAMASRSENVQPGLASY